MKIKKLVLLIIISITMIHCKKEIKSQKNGILKTEIEEIKKADIKLSSILISEMDSLGKPPNSIITLSINETQYEIAKVEGEAAKTANTSAIFPKNAISSIMTWWAGSGDFFYVIQKGNKIIVYKGWDGEGNESGGYNWEIAKEVNL